MTEKPELKTYEIWEGIPDTLTGFDFSGTYIDKSGIQHDVTIFDSSYFLNELIERYSTRKFLALSEDPEAAFLAIFTRWKNSRGPLYFKMAYAYTLKYNPIENYASVESLANDITTHAHGKTETTTHTADQIEHRDSREIKFTPGVTETTTLTPEVKKTTTTVPTDTETEYTSGFNESSLIQSGKTERGGNVKVTEEQENSDTTTVQHEGFDTTKNSGSIFDIHTGSVSLANTGTDTDTRNYTLTKTGNIGVMTAAQMLESEYNGLVQDLAERALQEFVARYTFYVEGGDL